MRKFLLLFVIGLSLVLTTQIVRAATLTLDKIGVTSTSGQIFTLWTYEGTNPRFEGTASASAQVAIKISQISETTQADASGNWTYDPTTLTEAGDYPIQITSGADTIAFTLTIAESSSTDSGSTVSAETKGGVEYPETLPQTSTFSTTLMLVLGGGIFIAAGMFLYWKLIPQLLFETASGAKEQ
ncbi:MAG: LPXTG cell wall anchor domain-containing protein [Patescibacteria group bacterium]